MKRDLELIRKIMLGLEAEEHGYPNTLSIAPGEYTEEQIGFHQYLLLQADYARGIDFSHANSPSPQAALHHLTWEGYEFLEVAKSDRIWRKAISKLSEHAVGTSLELLRALLLSLAKQQLGVVEGR